MLSKVTIELIILPNTQNIVSLNLRNCESNRKRKWWKVSQKKLKKNYESRARETVGRRGRGMEKQANQEKKKKKTWKTRTYLFSLAVLSINHSTLHLFLGVYIKAKPEHNERCVHMCAFLFIQLIQFLLLSCFMNVKNCLFSCFYRSCSSCHSLYIAHTIVEPSLNIPSNFFLISSPFLIITNKLCSLATTKKKKFSNQMQIV